jgi:hypothetical protein
MLGRIPGSGSTASSGSHSQQPAGAAPLATYQWGGLAQLNLLQAPASTTLVFYSPPALLPVRCSRPCAAAAGDHTSSIAAPSEGLPQQLPAEQQPAFGAQEVQLRGGLLARKTLELSARNSWSALGDVSIAGMPGWVAVHAPGASGPVVLEVLAPRGVEVLLRPAMPLPLPPEVRRLGQQVEWVLREDQERQQRQEKQARRQAEQHEGGRHQQAQSQQEQEQEQQPQGGAWRPGVQQQGAGQEGQGQGAAALQPLLRTAPLQEGTAGDLLRWRYRPLELSLQSADEPVPIQQPATPQTGAAASDPLAQQPAAQPSTAASGSDSGPAAAATATAPRPKRMLSRRKTSQPADDGPHSQPMMVDE